MQIEHLNSTEDIKHNDIWVLRKNGQRWRITFNNGAIYLKSLQNVDAPYSYQASTILNGTNRGEWYIERTSTDEFRRVDCSSGCGSFILAPGEEWRETCGVCK